MEPDYVQFECTFTETRTELGKDCPAIACTSIDGYPADENGEGTVIAHVWLLPGKKLLVDWHHNGYRLNQSVLDCIEQAKKDLLATEWPAEDDPAVIELIRLQGQCHAFNTAKPIRDMDTVLADILDEKTPCSSSGLSLLEMRANAASKEDFDALFLELTGRTWSDYITRACTACKETLDRVAGSDKT